MSVPMAALRAALAGMIAVLMVIGGIGSVASSARADSAPLDPANPVTPTTVTADPLPTVQIDGVAWAQVVVGNTVYVAGKFTTARPAGAAPGTQGVARNNLLAYDIRTGALITSFAPSLNAQALSIAASPDGTRIYVGGDFTTANGQARNRMAAYSTATGELISTFRPAFSSQVTAIAATNTAVYAGGWFTAVGSTARRNLAAVSAANGALLPWAPVPGGGAITNPSTSVLALTVTNGGSQVVAGGRFGTLNGVKAVAVGALDATSGATRAFAVNQLITNQGEDSAVYSLTTEGNHVYGTAYDFGGPGNLEGSFKVAANGGQLVWVNACRGDTYSSFPSNGALYMATHAHECAQISGFPEQSPQVNMFGTAVSLEVAGTVGPNTFRNKNFAGKPAPALLPWYPTFYSGTYTGQFQAGWSVTGNSQYVVYGGEFPGVNGSEQQGLVRFAVPSIAPNKVAPRAATPFTPTATMIPGAVRISWKAVSDRDNEYLTYRVYRDSDTTAPVCKTTGPSTWWQLPTYACGDTGATAGAHRYLVTATDPAGNSLASTWIDATVPATSSAARPYTETVRADGAVSYWPLGESSGSTAHDQAATLDLTINGGVTRGRPGALKADANTAFSFNGSSSGYLASKTAITAPQTFSVEAWFQTTSASGGKIIGFGNSATGNSTSYDRHVYLDAQGRVSFGIYSGAQQTVTSPARYNDGKWHHVVASMSPAGMVLHLDGQRVASRADTTSAQAISGFWRIGGDTTWSGSGYLNGLIDEAAVYPTVLSPATVARHFAVGTGANTAPTAGFTSTTSDLDASFDASSSADADGRVVSYAWNFGDDRTGTGATPSHTYAAAGTYQVTLTVTDDDGATGTTTQPVTVTAPPTGSGSYAADAFGRDVASGWGTADRGGAWTVSGGLTNAEVAGGAGQLTAAAGRSMSANLNDVSRQDVAVQADFTLQQAATGGGTYVYLATQRVGTSDYRATLRFQSTGAVDLRVDRVVDGAETVLGITRLPGTHTVGSALTVRFETSGTGTATLRAKAWAAGTAEPAGWTLTRTDDTASLQRKGALRVEAYTSGSATRPSVLLVDNVRAEPAGTFVEPVNAAPTAAFASSVDDLAVAVDGSASADADGRVVSYDWNFGNGARATGATASYTYATAGTYQVTLTVTDDDGATGTVTKAVTATAPTPPPADAPSALDAFGRGVASGWGSADVGGAWTIGGSTAAATVVDGAGQLTGQAGKSTRAGLAGVSQRDVAVQADIMLPQAPTGGGTYISLAGRRVGTSDYRATLRIQASGAVDLRLDRIVDGAETALRTVRLPGTYTAGTPMTVRLELTGEGTTTLKGKAWGAGTAEPADWMVTTTDDTAALQAPGGLYVETYTASTATRAQVLRIDNLRAGAPGTMPTR